jgi:hypothetical protein
MPWLCTPSVHDLHTICTPWYLACTRLAPRAALAFGGGPGRQSFEHSLPALYVWFRVEAATWPLTANSLKEASIFVSADGISSRVRIL